MIQVALPPVYALGQEAVPYARTIQELTRNFPRCFTSREVLPTIGRAQAFARSVNTGQLSRFASESADPAGAQRAMDRTWWTLEYWRKRLSTEASATYCPGQRNGATSTDRWQIIQAVVGPYQEASGIAGASQVVAQATRELLDTLTFGIGTGNPRWWLNLNYLVPIFLGVGAVALYGRLRGAKPAPPPPPPRPLEAKKHPDEERP